MFRFAERRLRCKARGGSLSQDASSTRQGRRHQPAREPAGGNGMLLFYHLPLEPIIVTMLEAVKLVYSAPPV